MKVCGKDIQVQGGLIRIARLGAEGYEFLEDPEAALAAFRSLECGSTSSHSRRSCLTRRRNTAAQWSARNLKPVTLWSEAPDVTRRMHMPI